MLGEEISAILVLLTTNNLLTAGGLLVVSAAITEIIKRKLFISFKNVTPWYNLAVIGVSFVLSIGLSFTWRAILGPVDWVLALDVGIMGGIGAVWGHEVMSAIMQFRQKGS